MFTIDLSDLRALGDKYIARASAMRQSAFPKDDLGICIAMAEKFREVLTDSENLTLSEQKQFYAATNRGFYGTASEGHDMARVNPQEFIDPGQKILGTGRFYENADFRFSPTANGMTIDLYSTAEMVPYPNVDRQGRRNYLLDPKPVAEYFRTGWVDPGNPKHHMKRRPFGDRLAKASVKLLSRFTGLMLKTAGLSKHKETEVVPQRQLHRVFFSREIASPAMRTGVIGGYKSLQRNVSYLVTEKMLRNLKEIDPQLYSEPVPPKPFDESCHSLLVFFPGGIGDVICLQPCLASFRDEHPFVNLGVVSTMADQCLIGEFCTLWDYPIRAEVAETYDAWVNIAELDLASMQRELPETFSEYIGVPVPTEPPRLKLNMAYVNGLKGMLKPSSAGRPKVGVCLKSASHYRSIMPYQGALAMMYLADKGCDCYVIGTSDAPIVFTHGGGRSAPPPHIYDMSGMIDPMEHFMAFISLMDVMLTADTAGMHVAGALGIPTVSVFGMTDGSKRTGYYPSVTYIQGRSDCSPCERIASDSPCENKWCEAIMAVEPIEMADKVLEALNGNSSG